MRLKQRNRRRNTQFESAKCQIFFLRDVVSNDETLVFADASGRLAFIRRDYVDEGDEIGTSHAVVIGGDEPPMFPLTAVPAIAVTLHQGVEGLPPLAGPETIDTAAAERLCCDRRGSDVVIGRTEEGILRAVTAGGSEPEYPCTSRGAGSVLTLGRAVEV